MYMPQCQGPLGVGFFLPWAFFLLLVFKLLNQSIQHIMLRHVLHNVIKDGSDFARQKKKQFRTDSFGMEVQGLDQHKLFQTLFPKGELHAQKVGFCLQTCFQKFHVTISYQNSEIIQTC